MHRRFVPSLITLMLISLLANAAIANDHNWPAWRGADATGVAEGDSYPIEFSASEGIVWKYELPGLGASTPVIWEDSIILTGESDGQNSVLCLSRSGDKRWERQLGEVVRARNRKASGCNSSPVTDGKYIYAYFKSGQLSCLDMAGELVWEKNLQDEYGEDTLFWDQGTSPVLTRDSVVIACMQSRNSYLVAFEKATGEVSWKQERNLNARGESEQSYTTPLVIDQDDRQLIVVLGSDHVTAHQAADGELVWEVGGLNPRGAQNWRSISSPIVSEGMVVAPYGRGNSLTAIRLGGEGDVTDSHVVWSNGGPAADVPTPAVADGKLYVCTDRGGVHMFDLASGDTLHSLDLPRSRSAFSASPVLAGGHLYLVNEDGSVFVVSVGETLELKAQNEMEDFTVATPVFADGRIYLRTDKYLHCIGE